MSMGSRHALAPGSSYLPDDILRVGNIVLQLIRHHSLHERVYREQALTNGHEPRIGCYRHQHVCIAAARHEAFLIDRLALQAALQVEEQFCHLRVTMSLVKLVKMFPPLRQLFKHIEQQRGHMVGMQCVFVAIAVETCIIETAQAVDQTLHLVNCQVFALSVEGLYLLVSLPAGIGQKAQQFALAARQSQIGLIDYHRNANINMKKRCKVTKFCDSFKTFSA